MEEFDPHPRLLLILEGLTFPATKDDVILHAEENGASETVLDQLQGIPDEEFNSRTDLYESISIIEDLPGHENIWGSAEMGDENENTDILG